MFISAEGVEAVEVLFEATADVGIGGGGQLGGGGGAIVGIGGIARAGC